MSARPLTLTIMARLVRTVRADLRPRHKTEFSKGLFFSQLSVYRTVVQVILMFSTCDFHFSVKSSIFGDTTKVVLFHLFVLMGCLLGFPMDDSMSARSR